MSEAEKQAYPKTRDPIRVAIVGGGCAGLAAAWHLSKLRGYEVSVYEQSWRLGGKGASGRDANGRIHEHGLHVWLGFYENAFKMIRDCYDEVAKYKWGPDEDDPERRLAHASFDQAFFPEPHIGVRAEDCQGNATVWSGLLPPEKGLPGDPLDAATNPFTLANYLLRAVDLLKTLILSEIGPPADDVPGKPRPDMRSIVDEMLDLTSSLDSAQSLELLVERVAGKLRDGSLTIAAAVLQATTTLETILQDLNHSPQMVGAALNLLKAVAAQARKQLQDVAAIDENLRRKTEIIDIVMTIAVGLYRDRVLFSEHGLDAINDMDYRAWLQKHGATSTSLKSQFITGIYDLVFVYEEGDRNRPRLAAGVALRGALRMFFTYRGAMFWRMRSGMGDAVFAPLYKVLARDDRTAADGTPLRPVAFHFRHSLTEVGFDLESKDRRFVTRLRFEKPATDADVPVLDNFGCWPDEDPLGDGTGDPQTIDLELDQHFEAVIFATGRDDFAEILDRGGIGSHPDIPKHWRHFGRRNQTVGTKAGQVWMAKDLEEIGWFRGPAIITALEGPFDTWADMTHTLPTERAWREAAGRRRDPADKGRSVAYFCGVMADRPDGNERVELDLNTLFESSMRGLWPKLEATDARVSDVVLANSFKANLTGSARYSLSLPGTIADRISPLELVILNMTVAGDWTACGLDAGCVEAAVMSGMLAAFAITGTQPTLESIVGYDHP